MINWQHWHVGRGEPAPAAISDDLLILIDTLSYGKPEDHGATWTKDSHTYSIYTLRLGYAIKVEHGGGVEWLVSHYQTSTLFLKRQLDKLDDAGKWEICDMLFSTYKAGWQSGQSDAECEYRTAFAEGRLKKRKIRNQTAVKIWIEPAQTISVSTT